ncbi:MAG: hypothetical protein CSA42_07280, partial [Gammaproteobacteria bacterium]
MVNRRQFILGALKIGLLAQCTMSLSKAAILESIGSSLEKNSYYLQIELSNPTIHFVKNQLLYIYLPMNIERRQILKDIESKWIFELQSFHSGHNVLKIEIDKLEPWSTSIINIKINLLFPYFQNPKLNNNSKNSINSYESLLSLPNSDKDILLDTAKLLKSPSTMQTIQNTFEWVESNFTPSNYNAGFMSINKLWKTKTGDCSEFSLVTSYLLRCNQIPSRNMGGYLLHNTNQLSMNYYHNWCEAILEDHSLIVDAYTKKL